MKDETKQILKIVTQMQKDMVTKKEFGVLKSDVGTLKSEMSSLKNEVMQNTATIAQTERNLYNQIAAVHKDLSQRLDNHDGFTKEIDHVLGRVTFIENHLGLSIA